MWARVARFEGDPGDIDARVERLSAAVESGALPPELADAKMWWTQNSDPAATVLPHGLPSRRSAAQRGDAAMAKWCRLRAPPSMSRAYVRARKRVAGY